MQQRLYEITTLLVARGSATAAELAARFGVSSRTIYRDIDALSAAGVPVYAEQGRGGGIRLLPGYVMDRSLFSEEEKGQLLAHFQSLASLRTPGSEQLADKLSALFGPGQSWLEVDFAPWDGGDDARHIFGLIRDAILARQVVTFAYSGTSGQREQRVVEPARVVFRGQGWYLYGYAQERKAFRFFKLGRIRDIALTGATFTPRPLPPQPQPHIGAMLEVTLRIAASAAYRVYDEFPDTPTETDSAGNLTLHCRLPEGGWLVGYLLSFGDELQVLSPPALRGRMATAIEAMRKNYAGQG